MFWTQYDRGMGAVPTIGDRVENCYLGDSYADGAITGVFAGWSSFDRVAAIIILDKPLPTGELAIAMPATCLRKIRQ